MNSIKTIPTVALVAILVISLTPTTAFALSAEEELAQGALNDYDPFAQPVTTSSSFTTSQTDVTTELQFLVDVSGSVDDDEFNLQRDGYIAAFNGSSTDILDIITEGCPGEAAIGIAATFIYWSGAAEQQQAVGWTLINDAQSARDFSNAIGNASRPFSGLTAPGSAIDFANPLFTNNFDGQTMVMDISGDGVNNTGSDVVPARDAALADQTDVINGIYINPDAGGVLQAFYEDELTGPDPQSVALEATTFADFAAVLEDKIEAEICEDFCDLFPTDPQCVVGGESLRIDTASLLVAGIYANALWILPVLAGVAGTGAYFIRTRMNKD